jgi:hypothetical protein
VEQSKGGKTVSDTPKTDEQINGKPCTRFEILAGDSLRNAAVPSEFARTLERELNATNAEIERLTNKVAQLYEGAEEAKQRIKLLESVANDPHALWANWLRGSVALPVGIGDVRQYQDRIKRLEKAGDELSNCSDIYEYSIAITKWREAKEEKP